MKPGLPGPTRTLLTQRSCVELFPPVLHQADILSDHADVVVLDAASEKDRTDLLTSTSVKRVRVTRRAGTSTIQARLGRVRWMAEYIIALRRELSRRPDLVIAYEPEAAVGILYGARLAAETKLVVHLHEIPTDDVASGRMRRLIRQALLRRIGYADLVILPDRHRARYLSQIANLRRPPMVVMNCPRRMDVLPESRLIPFLRARGIATSRIVHYQGAVGPSKSLENIVRSMPAWPADAVFVVVGDGSLEYTDGLRRLASEVGVADRLVLVGRVPYDHVLGFGVGAAVGMTMLDPYYPNWRFSAGASNKRFEYIALGVPQVTVEAPGVDDVFGRSDVAAIADHTDPSSISQSISRFLGNASYAADVGARARSLHLKEYNYEHQFAPVLKWMSAEG